MPYNSLFPALLQNDIHYKLAKTHIILIGVNTFEIAFSSDEPNSNLSDDQIYLVCKTARQIGAVVRFRCENSSLILEVHIYSPDSLLLILASETAFLK